MPLIGIALGIALALLTIGASAAPAPFSLTFDGAHVSDPTMPFGLRHEGRFTASDPFCSAGRAYDTRQVVDGQFLAAWRIFTCDDGSGSFTAFIPADVANEHGGRGSWKIVEGTGRYAELRGQGTYVGTHVSGNPGDFPTVVYRVAWQGVADFDANPPVIETLGATARKLPKGARAYTLRVAVNGRDASPIAYTIDVRAGRTALGSKSVSTTSGRAAATLRILAPRGTRSVRVAVAAADALGNGPTTASRTIKLPSRSVALLAAVDRATSSLSLNSSLALWSSAVPGCTPPPFADHCGIRRFEGAVPGLGQVKGAYSYLLKLGAPSCPPNFWRAIAYPIRIAVGSKGELELAVEEATSCDDENTGRSVTQTFTVSGGTASFAGASGSGTLRRSIGQEQCDASACYRLGFEIVSGTLTVPGHDFDVTAPTFSGATAKLVKAKRGAKSARVIYRVTATDDRDGALAAACAPKSGNRFPIGRTAVTCKATDGSANTGTARFTVTVKRTR